MREASARRAAAARERAAAESRGDVDSGGYGGPDDASGVYDGDAEKGSILMSRFVASHQVGRLIISIAQGHDCTREHGDVVAGSVLVDVAVMMITE
eukprot:9475415-Pyramimonas_sp.AAC.1